MYSTILKLLFGVDDPKMYVIYMSLVYSIVRIFGLDINNDYLETIIFQVIKK